LEAFIRKCVKLGYELNVRRLHLISPVAVAVMSDADYTTSCSLERWLFASTVSAPPFWMRAPLSQSTQSQLSTSWSHISWAQRQKLYYYENVIQWLSSL